MPKQPKIPRTYKMLPLADALIKEEAENTGESEADIIAGAVLALFAKYPEYQDRILEQINRDKALVELFEALQSRLGQQQQGKRGKSKR